MKISDFASHLWSEKAPLWISVSFAIVAWTVTTLVDRVVKSPAVEFSIKTVHVDPHKNATYDKRADIELENLSRSESYKKFKIVVRRKDDSYGADSIKFAGEAVKDFVKVSLNEGKLFDEFAVIPSDDAIQLEVSPFPSEGKLRISILYKGSGEPGVVASSGDDSKSVNVTSQSLATVFAKNEAPILGGGCALVVFLIVSMALLNKPKKDSSAADVSDTEKDKPILLQD